MTRCAAFVGALAIACLAAACSSGDSDGSDGAGSTATTPTTTTIEIESTAEAVEPPTDDVDTDVASATTQPAETTPTTEPEPTSALADALGLRSINLLTPPSGGGDRPDLTWESVDGADTYQITLLDPDGAFYWGWTGTETAVPFGGLPRLVPEAAGPRIIPEMTWTVTAYDEVVAPIAIGGPAPLSP